MKIALPPAKYLTSILFLICCSMGSVVAEEGDSYYLEQMRQQSQTEVGKPAQALPVTDEELVAEIELESDTETDENLVGISAVKPDFDKDALKPEL